MINKRQLLLSALFITALTQEVSIAMADTDQENVYLERVSSILNATYPLIDKAQAVADKNTRVKFQYNLLKQDIQKIQAGIAQKVNASQVKPRVVVPLSAAYQDQPDNKKSENTL